MRDLVRYYVTETAHGRDRDRLLGTIISVVCGVPVTAATVYDTTHARARCARIMVPAEHCGRFARIFPDSRRLKDPAPGIAAFRVAGGRGTTRS